MDTGKTVHAPHLGLVPEGGQLPRHVSGRGQDVLSLSEDGEES